MKRLIAMLLASVAAVLLIAYTGGMSSGKRTDGLYYKAAGIHPDAELLEINGQTVTAEEYLYWLAYVCEYLNATAGGKLDLQAQVNETTTFGEYAKMDALNTVKLYAVTRAWAAENGMTLTEEDEAALETQRQQYVAYYGGEEAYQKQLELLGITAEMLHDIEATPYLYVHLRDAFVAADGILYPGEEALTAFGNEKGYLTARLLYFATTGMDDTGKADVRAKAESYAEKMQQAEDKNATFAELEKELGLETNAAGLTFRADTSDPAVSGAVDALEEGQVSGVIEGSNGFYVALRMPLNQQALLEDLFQQHLQEMKESAKIEYHTRLYNKIDTAEFYRRLTEERAALQQGPMGQVPSLNQTPGN